MLLRWLIRKDQQIQPSLSPEPKVDDQGPKNELENSEGQDVQTQSETEKLDPGPNSTDKFELVFPSNKQCIRQLVLLNAMCLPLNYGDENSAHYRCVMRNALAMEDPKVENMEIEHRGKYWTKMVYYCRKSLVGAITVSCSVHNEERTPNVQINILTLAVLPTFRRRGVAKRLLQELLKQCEQWTNIEKISLHCQVSNEPALALYRLYGFVQVEMISGFYNRCDIANQDAFRMELNFNERRLNKLRNN